MVKIKRYIIPMIFKREHPGHHSSRWVECFWIVENDDSTPHLQKIIPDGFIELIFHFADPYRINLGHGWEVQSASLLAGQITKHFFLENSGRTSIFGIKLKPSAPAYIFDLSMERLNNAVVDLDSVSCSRLIELREELRRRPNHEPPAPVPPAETAPAPPAPPETPAPGDKPKEP